MAAQKIARPAARAQLATGTIVGALDPTVVSRHLSELADAVDRNESSAIPTRAQLNVDLAVGDNSINHGLGRKARGAFVSPTVADPTWAYAVTAISDKTITITCVGVPQPSAFVEVT